jgi:hypothetical protein
MGNECQALENYYPVPKTIFLSKRQSLFYTNVAVVVPITYVCAPEAGIS